MCMLSDDEIRLLFINAIRSNEPIVIFELDKSDRKRMKLIKDIAVSMGFDIYISKANKKKMRVFISMDKEYISNDIILHIDEHIHSILNLKYAIQPSVKFDILLEEVQNLVNKSDAFPGLVLDLVKLEIAISFFNCSYKVNVEERYIQIDVSKMIHKYNQKIKHMDKQEH